MTKIQQLFRSLTEMEATPNAKEIFHSAGMVHEFARLDFGFFPLGSGVFTEDSEMDRADIKTCEVMVLGNDFGTITYVNEKCANGRENNSATIRNLEQIGLTLDNTFFTNFYLGLRDDINFPQMTMTKLAVKRSATYQACCFEYFKLQLQVMDPKIIVCLGKQVGSALNCSMPNSFPAFAHKNMNLSQLYLDENKPYVVNIQDAAIGDRTFIFIPHPSYAHINWAKHGIKEKIKAAIGDAGSDN